MVKSVFDTFNYDDFSPKKSIEEIYSNTKEKIIKECFYWTLLEEDSKKNSFSIEYSRHFVY